MTVIEKNLNTSIALKEEIVHNKKTILAINEITHTIVTAYKKGGKVFFCGNGGSAADAQHLAAELSGRYYYDRPPLFAEALHVNTSYLTSVANDYSYDEIYKRLISAVATAGDVLIGLSTSGNSNNVILALEKAKSMGCITVGLTGLGGGRMKEFCDHIVEIPSTDTPRIQECHMIIGHSICEVIERELFPK